jgi:hypothetical protein
MLAGVVMPDDQMTKIERFKSAAFFAVLAGDHQCAEMIINELEKLDAKEAANLKKLLDLEFGTRH